MANTRIIYQGDGSTTDFAVPFDYLKKSFVKVYIDTSTELKGGSSSDTSADYYFVDNNTIRLRKIIPTSSQTVTIRRFTSTTERVASFRDGSVLYAKDLDVSQVQAYHIAEEARDIADDALNVDLSNNWDAKNRRIINVADPVDPTDAVNKQYMDAVENDAAIHADSARASAGIAASAVATITDKATLIEQLHTDVKRWREEVNNNTQLTSEARDKAVEAKTASETARDKAVEAKTASETARDKAEEWAQKAKEYSEQDKGGSLTVASYMETRRKSIGSPWGIYGGSAEYLARKSFYFIPDVLRLGTSAGEQFIQIPRGTYIEIGARLFYTGYTTNDLITLTPLKEAGKDFYIYAVIDKSSLSGTSPYPAKFVISANSTVPEGYDEETSRKIGGYHCLCADVGTIDGHPLSGYKAGDILPNSIWDLWHRPASDPEGMVYDPNTDIWVDIYLAHWDGTKFVSMYTPNVTVTTSLDSNGKAFHGERFNEAFLAVKKELPSRQQFLSFADGSLSFSNALDITVTTSTGGSIITKSAVNYRSISNIGVESCTCVAYQFTSSVIVAGMATNIAKRTYFYNASVDTEDIGDLIGTSAIRILVGGMIDPDSVGGALAVGKRSVYACLTPSSLKNAYTSSDTLGFSAFSARGVSQPLNKWANQNRNSMS